MNLKVINIINKNRNILISLFFIIYFCSGIIITKDYGVSSDEYANRFHGFVTINHVTKKFFPSINKKYIKDKNYPELKDHIGKSYGVLFSVPTGIIEVLFKIEDKKNQFLLRHYINFIIFFISTIFFFKIIIHKYGNWKLALIGSTLLILSPRIFANSFYNNIDLLFMSLMIIAVYFNLKFFENQNIKNALLCGLFTAFLIAVRIPGIIILFSNVAMLLLINLYYKSLILNYKPLLIYIFSTIFFMIIFWPVMWENTFENFFYALNEMANYWISVENLFFGQKLNSLDLPWYYIPAWIIITTPALYIFFFIIGLVFFIKNIKRFFLKKVKIKFFYNIYFIGILFSALISFIYLNSTFYNGWRHAYFLYPFILLISIDGLFNLFQYIKNIFIKYIFIVFIFTQLVITFTWMFKNHPHQYVYFNSFIKGNLTNKIELDYWGLSYKQSLDFLLAKDKSKNIKIYNLSLMKPFYYLFSLDKLQRSRITEVKNIDEADYLITNYYSDDTSYDDIFYEKYEVYFDIKVDESSINTIFKKN